MGSSKPAEARPVRSPPSSCFKSWIAPCMRRLSSLRSCVGLAMATSRGWTNCEHAAPLAAGMSLLFADDGEASLPAQHRGDRPLLADREHNDRHTVFPSKR